MDLTIDKERVMKLAAEQIANDVFNHRDDVFSEARKLIHERVEKAWAESVEHRIQEIARDAVTDGFEKSYQRIDEFGRPVGEPTTVASELNKLIADYWTEKVDGQGRPSTGYGAQKRAEWMMVQVCGKDFSKQMQQEVTNATAELKDGLRVELRKQTDAMLSKVFHVRSSIDKEEGRRS